MKKSSKKHGYLKKVGLNIRKARKEKGISQESLALAADLDRSYVGGVERGERNIAIVNLKKIADALKVPNSKRRKNVPDYNSKTV
jgi:transcriptional regulator with XRE-family HTH domain